MADKKTLLPEQKQLAAEKHVDGLVQKALVALDGNAQVRTKSKLTI